MGVSVGFSIDRAAVHNMLHSPSGDLGRMIRRIGNDFVKEAKSRAPVKTGALKNSIQIVKFGPNLVLEAGPTVDYAAVVSTGQPARPIYPKRRQVLRFPDKAGVIIYRPRAENWHGTKPNPYLLDALKAVVARNL
jgi:hypothetical protein